MNLNTRNRVLAAGSFITCVALSGQTPAPTPAASEEAIVELSPFVVTSTQDTGYRAASTLVGTRLNTQVKDLGASISIYTKDFLNDIGATNTSELLIYGTSTEAAGPGGNFSGTNSDINAAFTLNGGQQSNPQGASRSRGLAAPSFTRGLCPSSLPMDSYNTEAVTVNRGANAILFGTGSPAGVVDTSLIQADIRRDSNTVVARYGDNDSYRASIDLNHMLIPQKLALRIAALRDKNEFDQRPAFEDKRRIFGAVAYQPARSSALRVSFESGNTMANRPITIPPFDNMSSFWYAAGRPGFDWSFYDDPARNPSAAAQNAGSFVTPMLAANRMAQPQVLVGYNNPGDTSPGFSFVQQLANTTGTAADVIKNQVFNPLVNRDLAADTITFLSTRNIAELPGSFWTASNVLPGNLPGLVPAGLKSQGFTNYDAFNFAKHQIYENGRQSESFHAFDVALEQRAWQDRIGAELAYHAERYDTHDRRDFMFGSTTSHVRIDANVTLPNGQPNPNFGRPFILSGQQGYGESFTERESLRATAFLRFNFKDLSPTWGRWLGRHILTGLYQKDARDGISTSYRLALDGAAAKSLSPNVGAINRRPLVITYMGPSIIGNNNPLRLEPVKTPLLQAGPANVPISATSYYSRAANATDPGTFLTAPVSFVELNNGSTLSRDVIKSQAFVLQSYWLKEYLITTVGWRRDEDYFSSQAPSFVANPSDPNDSGKVHYGFADISFPRTPPLLAAGETTSWSAVLRWPTRLPKGVDFRLFFNQASNFAPRGGVMNGFFQPLPSQQGNTKEFGFNLSAFADKLTIRFNTFETNQTNLAQKPSALTNLIYNGFVIAADNWATEANINPQLATQRNADLQLLLSLMPSNYLDFWSWKLAGAAPNLTTTHVLAGQQNIADTSDYSAKGLEMDVTYNPTPNWRIMANVSKQETVQSNVLPFLGSLIERMTPVWNQLGGVPYGHYPEGWKPGDSLAGVQLLRDWLSTNVLVPYYTAQATAGSRSAEQRKWRANLVTSYTFSRESPFGPALKGWSIGTGIRWQDKVAIGYPYKRNADQSVSLDIAHPYFGPQDINVDGWIGYGRKVWQNRINWKVRLSATNLIGGTSLIPISTQPLGETAFARIPPEKRWYLTNTFGF